MNGILNVYKERGYTSHDVVARLRGICRQKKIGHTGTLDPDAEGVLPVCLGTAAKICGLLTDKDKVYEAVLLLGVETDTQDISGKVLKEEKVTCRETDILDSLRSFIGTYDQVPPMYSALKVNGRRLCDLARAGIEVERKARPVQIYDISVEWIQLPRVKIRVHCSKGTYIRTLCHDAGRKLGCGGCMESLLRTRVSIFELSDAWKLPQIQQMAAENRIEELLIPPDRLFMDYPAAGIREQYRKLLENGNRMPQYAFVTVDKTGETGIPQMADMPCKEYPKLRVYLEKTFFGLYEFDRSRGDYKPEKIFWQR